MCEYHHFWSSRRDLKNGHGLKGLAPQKRFPRLDLHDLFVVKHVEKLFTLRAPRRGQARGQRPNFINFLYIFVFLLKIPGTFRDFLGDHFAPIESSGNPSDHAHPGFRYFFPFLTPPKSHENPSFPLPLQNPFPWDHAQMIERKILFMIALTRALYDQIRP